MAREQFQTDTGDTITLAMDDDSAAGAYMSAVLVLQVVDELTGKSLRGPVALKTSMAGLTSRSTDDGLAGLAGIPAEVFPALATHSYSISFSVQAVGYLDHPITVMLNSDPDFPNHFGPAILPDALRLHRRPVVIHGRIVRASVTRTIPVAGAHVHMTGIWQTALSVAADAPPDQPWLVGLQPPLYAGRPAGPAHLRRLNMTPVAGADKQLLVATAAGARTIGLSDGVGLAPGEILMVDAGQPDRVEYLEIQSVSGGSVFTQPFEVTLGHALAYPHRRNSLVCRVTLDALGPQRLLTVDAIPGDGVVFVSNLVGLKTAHHVQTNGGGPPVEYHNVQHFIATSDGDGYYRLPPLSRVAKVRLEATDGMHAPVSIDFAPDYAQPENRVDFVFR